MLWPCSLWFGLWFIGFILTGKLRWRHVGAWHLLEGRRAEGRKRQGLLNSSLKAVSGGPRFLALEEEEGGGVLSTG